MQYDQTEPEIPPDFRYREVLLKGKPRHDKNDAFSARHPAMDPGQRAKIFAPFDALRGFREAVSEKELDAARQDVQPAEPDSE